MGLLLLGLLMWHPFHVSIAEAQWNAEGTRLQVSLRLSPADVDAALSEVVGRRIELERETDEERQRLLTEYLRDAIFLSPSRDAAKQRDPAALQERRERFVWVGMEDEVRYLWVYFELKRSATEAEGAAGSFGGTVWLTNRVMVEAEPTQINTLQLLRTEKPVAVRTTKETPTKELPIMKSQVAIDKAS